MKKAAHKLLGGAIGFAKVRGNGMHSVRRKNPFGYIKDLQAASSANHRLAMNQELKLAKEAQKRQGPKTINL